MGRPIVRRNLHESEFEERRSDGEEEGKMEWPSREAGVGFFSELGLLKGLRQGMVCYGSRIMIDDGGIVNLRLVGYDDD